MKLKQNYWKVGVLLAAFTLLSLTYPAMAKDHNKGPLLFKGVETGVVISDVLPFVFPFASDGQQATGEATHFGHYTLHGDLVANVILGTAEGTFTITVANGDILFLDAEGGVVPTDLTKLFWTFTVTGGTGRFEGATGTITSTVQLAAIVGSISPNPYVAQLKGSISLQDEDDRDCDRDDHGGNHGHGP